MILVDDRKKNYDSKNEIARWKQSQLYGFLFNVFPNRQTNAPTQIYKQWQSSMLQEYSSAFVIFNFFARVYFILVFCFFVSSLLIFKFHMKQNNRFANEYERNKQMYNSDCVSNWLQLKFQSFHLAAIIHYARTVPYFVDRQENHFIQ